MLSLYSPYSYTKSNNCLPGDVAYRYETFTDSYVEYDMCGEFVKNISTNIRIDAVEYKVLSHTPKGFWIEIEYPLKKKFVLNNSRKKFASINQITALESFKARKEKHIRILGNQLYSAKEALSIALNKLN